MIIGSEGYIGSVLKLDTDAVIYLAFMSNNDMCERNPELARKLNTEYFSEVIKNSKGKRFIFASSVAAYGNCIEAAENSPMNPTTTYGIHKVICEQLLKNSDLNYTIVRCASVCGVSPKMRYDLMVNRMVRDATRKCSITVNGGEQQRSHVHINDVCRFYSWVLDNWKSRETYNLVCENMSVLETAKRVANIIGQTFINRGPYTDNRSYTINGDKLRKAGFEFKSTIEDAIVSVYLEQLYG